jgi:hypothetical protein
MKKRWQREFGDPIPLPNGRTRMPLAQRAASEAPTLQPLTQLRHRLCAAAKALMPVSNPIKVPFEPGQAHRARPREPLTRAGVFF